MNRLKSDSFLTHTTALVFGRVRGSVVATHTYLFNNNTSLQIPNEVPTYGI